MSEQLKWNRRFPGYYESECKRFYIEKHEGDSLPPDWYEDWGREAGFPSAHYRWQAGFICGEFGEPIDICPTATAAKAACEREFSRPYSWPKNIGRVSATP